MQLRYVGIGRSYVAGLHWHGFRRWGARSPQKAIHEAVEFFQQIPYLYRKVKVLQEVGLGYVKLGQSSSTLSGGEAQRVKLASFLGKGKASNKMLFIFDST